MFLTLGYILIERKIVFITIDRLNKNPLLFKNYVTYKNVLQFFLFKSSSNNTPAFTFMSTYFTVLYEMHTKKIPSKIEES
jgi:hypothetical protein